MTSKNAFWRQSDSSRSGRDELPDEAQLDVRRKCLMQRHRELHRISAPRRGSSSGSRNGAGDRYPELGTGIGTRLVVEAPFGVSRTSRRFFAEYVSGVLVFAQT